MDPLLDDLLEVKTNKKFEIGDSFMNLDVGVNDQITSPRDGPKDLVQVEKVFVKVNCASMGFEPRTFSISCHFRFLFMGNFMSFEIVCILRFYVI